MRVIWQLLYIYEGVWHLDTWQFRPLIFSEKKFLTPRPLAFETARPLIFCIFYWFCRFVKPCWSSYCYLDIIECYSSHYSYVFYQKRGNLIMMLFQVEFVFGLLRQKSSFYLFRGKDIKQIIYIYMFIIYINLYYKKISH